MAENVDLILGGFQGFNRDAQRLYPADPQATEFQKHLARVLQGEDPHQVAAEYHASKQPTMGGTTGGPPSYMPQGGNLSGPPVNNDGVPLPQSLGYEQNYRSPMMGPGQPGQGVEAPPEARSVPVDATGLGAAPTQTRGGGLRDIGSGLGNVAVDMPRSRAQSPGPEIQTQKDFESLMEAMRLKHAGRQQKTLEDQLALERLRQEGRSNLEDKKQGGKASLQEHLLNFKNLSREDQQTFLDAAQGRDLGSKEKIAGNALSEKSREFDLKLDYLTQTLQEKAQYHSGAMAIFKALGDTRHEIDTAVREKTSAEHDLTTLTASGQRFLPDGKTDAAAINARLSAAEEAITAGRDRAKPYVEAADNMLRTGAFDAQRPQQVERTQTKTRVSGGPAAQKVLPQTQGQGPAQPAQPQGKPSRSERIQQLKAQGKSKDDALRILHNEGY